MHNQENSHNHRRVNECKTVTCIALTTAIRDLDKLVSLTGDIKYTQHIGVLQKMVVQLTVNETR